MADLFKKIKQTITGQAGELQFLWFDELSLQSPVESVSEIISRIKHVDLTEDMSAAIKSLTAIEDRARNFTSVLTTQLLSSGTLAQDVEDRFLQTGYDFYYTFEQQYRRVLQVLLEKPVSLEVNEDIGRIALRLIDSRRNMALWRYLDGQTMPDGGWLKQHSVYETIEMRKLQHIVMKRYDNVQPEEMLEISIWNAYLQSLLLNTMNVSNWRKSEILLVDRWIGLFCRQIQPDVEFDEKVHLYYVNLKEDRAARRVRRLKPSANDRFWGMTRLLDSLIKLQKVIKLKELPPELNLPPKISTQDALALIEHMLTEWSPQEVYKRQRRTEPRIPLEVEAEVVGGIQDVCQQVKNVENKRNRAGRKTTNAVRLTLEGEVPVKASTASQLGKSKWVIKNLSKHGFGGITQVRQGQILPPGKLLGMQHEQNPDKTYIGVLRSVRYVSGTQRYGGVEVLSHAPALITLRNLQKKSNDAEKPKDIYTAANVINKDGIPFAALYLPKDEDKGIAASILMPAFEYIEAGRFELKLDLKLYDIELGRIIELKDDWVRVEATLTD